MASIPRLTFLVIMAALLTASLALAACDAGEEGTTTPDSTPTVVVIGGTASPTAEATTEAPTAAPTTEAPTTEAPTAEAPTAAPTSTLPPAPTPEATSDPSPTLTPEPSPTPTPEPTPATVPVLAVVIAVQLNVRDQPSVETGAIQETLQEGAEIELTGEVAESADGAWRETADGNWVAEVWLGRGAFADVAHTGPATVIPVDGLNVRDVPNVDESTVQYVAPGTSEVILTGATEVVGRIVWRELDDGNWVQGHYLQIDVEEAPAT